MLYVSATAPAVPAEAPRGPQTDHRLNKPVNTDRPQTTDKPQTTDRPQRVSTNQLTQQRKRHTPVPTEASRGPPDSPQTATNLAALCTAKLFAVCGESGGPLDASAGTGVFFFVELVGLY